VFRIEKNSSDDPAGESYGQTGVSVYETRNLVLDGVRYYGLDGNNLPPAWTKVPVNIEQWGSIVKAEMYAGLMGVGFSAKGASATSDSANASHPVGGFAVDFTSNNTEETALDTVAPVAAWWITEAMGPKRDALRWQRQDYPPHPPGTSGRPSRGLWKTLSWALCAYSELT
jgi:hypothetical protein